MLLEDQAVIDHEPNGWSRSAIIIMLWLAQEVQQQQWDLLVPPSWKHADYPRLGSSFKLQQMRICASHLNIKNRPWSRLPLQSNHETTGEGVSCLLLLLQTMPMQLATPKPFHCHLENMQQPELEEHTFLCCIYL